MNILSKLHEMDNFEAVNCCCLVVELDGELLPVYLRHFRSVLDIVSISDNLHRQTFLSQL
jgi:hypothetical protein